MSVHVEQLKQTEQIEGKTVRAAEQVFFCPNGHHLIYAHRSLACAEVSTGPFDYGSGFAVGTTTVKEIYVPRKGMIVDIQCPRCPTEAPLIHLELHLRPGSRFRTFVRPVPPEINS